MKRIDYILMFYIVSTLLTALVLYFLLPRFSFDTTLVSDNALYVAEVILDLMTIVFCYTVPKMMMFDIVKKSIRDNEDNYMKWALLRCSMLNLVVILPIVFHFVLGCPSVIWCSLVGLVMMMFVWPSRDRRESEIARCKE